MSRLIVNADDLGYTAGINRAVLELNRDGALSSATLMAQGAATAAFPRPAPAALGLGCHVVLVDGMPAAPTSKIPSLLRGGRFRSSLARFAVDLELGRIRDSEIELEAVAQIRALQNTGCKLTHLDTHKHTHLFPRVLRPLLRAALQCGVPAVRNPFEPAWARAVTRKSPALRRAEISVLSLHRKQFLREVARAGLRTPDGALGVLGTGVLNTALLHSLLQALDRHASAADCYELVCHPGYWDAALQALPTRLGAERETERAALLDTIPAWTRAGRSQQLIHFGEL